MNLSKLSVKRPITITMIILIVILFGTISLSGLPIDLFPEVELPVAVVITNYSGTGPQEIETMITKPIEESIATVSNIDEVHSFSTEGTSLVLAQFNFNTDMDFAALEMREKVDLVKGFLPDDSEDPMVMKIDPNATPILQVAISSTSGNTTGLQSLSENEFQPRFERLEGVASVNIGGGLVDEISIDVDPYKLSEYDLDINQLRQVIAANNTNMPGGTVDSNNQELNIRIVGEFKSLDEIKNMPITLTNGSIIALQDIADVSFGQKDSNVVSRVNGVDSINISIQKQSDSNTIEVAENIHKELDKIQEEFPDLKMDVVLDSSNFIQLAIDNVISNVLLGSIFAIFVLYIFLKNMRSTLIVSASIPISLIASFILLYFNDITLNMMTLGGLALSVGMLVDSAIVVLENIYRFRIQGLDKDSASIRGANEVAMSITASTLTTIAVFLPIVFIEGFIGIMFKDFALTVTLSLVASMIVALTFIPMLSSQILEIKTKEEQDEKLLAPLYSFFDKLYDSFENLYSRILDISLNQRGITVAIAIIIFISSIISFAFTGTELLPDSDEGIIYVNLNLPIGSRPNDVDLIAKEVENKIKNIPEIETLFTNIGMTDFIDTSNNKGTITLNLVEMADRKRDTKLIADEVRDLVKDIPGAEITVRASSGTADLVAGGDPININIKGTDLEVLDEISKDIENIVDSVEGTRDTVSSIADAIPELEIKVKKEEAASYGLTTAQIASAVRTEVAGSTATRFNSDGDEIDVVISANEDLTDSLEDIQNLNISTPVGISIPLEQIANTEIIDGPVSIQRENQERVVSINSQLGQDSDLENIINKIDKEIKDYNMPSGYYYEFAGENEEMEKAFTQLTKALLVAIALIYMIMAAQFESLLHPFIIMFTIPLAFGGGLLALFLSGSKFGATAFIGIIMLAGIIVNNGIVLIDYINLLKKDGYSTLEAIKIAGPTRLRPILMTTLTTVLGLIPLALGIGEGAELQAPMAIVVIGGLLLGTLLTLVFIPVLFSLFDDLIDKYNKKGDKVNDSN